MPSLPPTSSMLHFWAWIQRATLGTPKFLSVPGEVFDLVLLPADLPLTPLPKSQTLLFLDLLKFLKCFAVQEAQVPILGT